LLSRQEQHYLEFVEDLNKPRDLGVKAGLTTRLHSGQIDALSCLYEEDSEILTLFLACGRKFGKTEAVGYILWKHAQENPGSACYYVASQAVHARKILWDKQRIQKFLYEDSDKYVKRVDNESMTVYFHNDSFIQLVGSDNYAIANGLDPDIAVYDEFKHFRPLWHTEFSPNRAARGAKLIFIGTKPRPENRNYRQYNSLLKFYSNDSRGKVITKTTFDNPINHMPAQKAAIELEIDQLRQADEEDVVQLEYYSKVIPGGKRAIFPMLDEKLHKKPHLELQEIVSRERDQLDFYCIADPGTSTVFGVLFVAYNLYSKKVYVLDEIYEDRQKHCSTMKIYPRIEAMCQYWNPFSTDIHDKWFLGYDEAGAWFANECAVQYGVNFCKTEKHLKTKEEGISLIRDQLNFEMILFNERCENTFLDMESYARKDNGTIPKENDHTIDDLRYSNYFAGYDMHEALEARKYEREISKGRFRRLEDEEVYNEDDWTEDLFYDF